MEIETNTDLTNGKLTITATNVSKDMSHDDFFNDVMDHLSDQGYIYNGDLIKDNMVPILNLYIIDPSGRAYSLIEYTNKSYWCAIIDLRVHEKINLYLLDEESTTDIKNDWF